MFRLPTSENTRRAVPQAGELVPFSIPFKGMNARSPFAVMGSEYAISLINVIPETYGLRTRKGYTEWASNIPGNSAVRSVMSYYPASAPPATQAKTIARPVVHRMFTTPRSYVGPPPGNLFAARNGLIYDVTNGGAGPWTAEAGVSGGSDYWTSINFQNAAGSFLLAANDVGGYAIFNGATWTMPTMGSDPGEIDGLDPTKICFVMEWKKRVWFIEKFSTRAWYLPVGQITGTVTAFDFGEQFARGGALASLVSWTVDGGDGMDDHLVAVSYQGDVVIYKGNDPDTAETFVIHGTWNCGPLPVGRRQVTQDGGDVNILSQLGVMPLSKLLQATSISALETQRISYLIDPIVSRLMQDNAELEGWQIVMLPKEELAVIGIPYTSSRFGGDYLAYKVTSQAWSVLRDTTYASLVNIGSVIYAGTQDGRVVRAFDGALDNVLIAQSQGLPITCQVTPAYQSLGTPGNQKRVTMVRPAFLSTQTPSLTFHILVDYGVPKVASVPTLPEIAQSLWDQAIWDQGVWSGLLAPIREWLGAKGVGFAATIQLDYAAGGDTLLTNIDFWVNRGGPL